MSSNLMQNLAAFLFDCFLSVWFFESEFRSEESLLRRAISCLPLLGIFPLVFSADFLGSMFVRFFYRWILLFHMLLLLKRRDALRCLYLSILCALTFAAQQNLLIFSKNATRYLITGSTYRLAVVLVLEYVIPFLLMTWVSRSIPFPRVIALKRHQLLMLALLTPSVLYVKENFFSAARALSADFTLREAVYPVIISVLVLIIIANYDRFWQLRVDWEEQLVLDVARRYQYQNLQNQVSAQEENRAVIHDIRNHLLALSSAGGVVQQEHVRELLENIDSANITADTGNETLDAILVQKQREAISQRVRMVADLDLRQAAPIGPMDTISIFANALDNALEAAAQVPAELDRYIRIRGGAIANLYVVRMTNSCTGNLQFRDDGLLSTGKQDAAHHGIGMRSMRRAVARIGGSLSFDQQDGSFTLTVSLPRRAAESD